MTKLSSTFQIANCQDSEPRDLDRSTRTTPSQSLTSQRPLVMDKTMSSAANLAQLLPTGTVLTFQALSPSFSNHGVCYISNKYITLSLILICTISCFLFSFTDSFKGASGKLYYGMATFKGFIVFNEDKRDERELEDLKKTFDIRRSDYVHAFFSAVVFLTVTFSDTNIQHCFFPNSGPNKNQIFQNLPLGAAFFSSVVFLIFPTARKGIGYRPSSRKGTVYGSSFTGSS